MEEKNIDEKVEEKDGNDENGNDNDDVKIVPAAGDEDFSIGAFVQVIILFYQVASLLKSKFQGKKEQGNKDTDPFIDGVNNLFNFR